jgi:hypothetical protein
MNVHEIEAASQLVSERKRAMETAEALANMQVIGVYLSIEGSILADPISLRRGCGSGTGSVNSIGWPDDLAEAMDKALHRWAEDKIEAANEALRRAGVEV